MYVLEHFISFGGVGGAGLETAAAGAAGSFRRAQPTKITASASKLQSMNIEIHMRNQYMCMLAL